MITRATKNLNFIDRVINKMVDGRTLTTLLLYSCLAVSCVVCFSMLQSVYSSYIWWTTTAEGQMAAAANAEELYRNYWWGALTVINNMVFILLFIRVVFSRLQQLGSMEYSIYPAIHHAGILAKTCTSLYFISAIWSLVGNNLQLLLKKQFVVITGIWQELFPYYKIKEFNDGQGNFVFSWNSFWSFNIEMIIYFLVITIILNFISQFILSYYTCVIEGKRIVKEESNKSNHVSNDNNKSLCQ